MFAFRNLLMEHISLKGGDQTHLIHELHQHKGIEDERVVKMGALSRGDLEKQVAPEHKQIHDCQLECTLPHNALQYLQRPQQISPI